MLTHWADLLAEHADVMLMDLPGHGRSTTAGAASISGMAATLHEAICAGLAGRRVLIMGESLGGTIALSLGGMAELGPIRAVFAADPPVTTGKLWTVANAFRRHMGNSAEETFVDRLGRETFGITPNGVEELIYYPLIGGLRVPTVIATGDIPLLPPRQLSGVTCLFDPVDQFVARTLYPGKTEIELIANCGHLLLVDAPSACLDIVRRMLAEHLNAPALS
ncbi:hypothetical protein ASE02_03965 [Phenylobacterium sp. Root700]|nr:hypothetical protein ASE02_03965 [Phenylobacterium sp. Root700]